MTQVPSSANSQGIPGLSWQQQKYLGYAVRYIIAIVLIVFAFVPVVCVV